MAGLEKERLLQMKKMNELAWQSRREEERIRKNKEWSKEVVEQVTEMSWTELENKKVKSKIIRLDKAQVKSLTSRLGHCTLSDMKRKKDWQQTESPCKLARGGEAINTILEGRGSTTIQNLKVKTTTTRPQVKTKKWVLKKNGFYGWVTSVKVAKSIGKPPQNTIPLGRGVENEENINLRYLDQTDGQGGLLDSAGDMARIRENESENWDC